jgi:NADP-dependent 3-hydroxy acid dehydrogenase YdfG
MRSPVALGPGGGFGQALAAALAEAGADIVLVWRHGAELEPAASAVRSIGREALAVEADIADESAVGAMVAKSWG